MATVQNYVNIQVLKLYGEYKYSSLEENTPVLTKINYKHEGLYEARLCYNDSIDKRRYTYIRICILHSGQLNN